MNSTDSRHGFLTLLDAHPEAVRSVLAQCVSGEWEITESSEHYHLLLNDLAGGHAAGDLIKPLLLERLQKSEPKNSHVLRDALSRPCLSPHPASESVADLCKVRADSLTVNGRTFPQWVALWLQVDALPAINALESQLKLACDPSHESYQSAHIWQGGTDTVFHSGLNLPGQSLRLWRGSSLWFTALFGEKMTLLIWAEKLTALPSAMRFNIFETGC